MLAGCGSGSSSTATGGSTVPTTADLDGTAYVSTSVEGHDLVADSHVRLDFQDVSLTALAGCNSLFGPYDVQDGRLSWTHAPAMTQLACPDGLMQQDQWLAGWLGAGADAALDGDTAALDNGEHGLMVQLSGPTGS